MQVLRDLIRDLVGILFPGGLFLIFTLWSLWAVVILISPSIPFDIFSLEKNFIVLLIFSYIAGQSLRMKRLGSLETKCTEEYRKKNFPNIKHAEWKEFVENLKKEEENYFEGKSDIERLKKVYSEYVEKFRFWEEFPYEFRLKARRFLHQPEDYIKFFEKYDKQGITKFETFFNFCKSVIFEYSPSFKEEMLRQESLVRLFAGIYYVIKYGKALSIITGILHILFIFGYHSKIGDFKYENIQLSYLVAFVSTLAFLSFVYMNKEILQRLRHMRVKEINLAFDAFYLISKEKDVAF